MAIGDNISNSQSQVQSQADAAKNKLVEGQKKFGDAKAKAEDAKKKAEEAKKKAEEAKKKLKEAKARTEKQFEDLKKAGKDLKGTIKGAAGDAGKKIQSLLVPIIASFTKAEFIANVLLLAITVQTKSQLKNKGTLIAQNGKFIFTPTDGKNYETFKSNFDRWVNNLNKAINALQNIITTLSNIVKYLNIAISAYQVFLKIKTGLLYIKYARIAAELATPSPAKPTVGLQLIQISKDLDKIKQRQKDVEEFKLGVDSAKAFLLLFNNSISTLKNKINKLSFTIKLPPSTNGTNPQSGIDTDNLSNSLNNVANTAPIDEEYVSALGKSYTLKLVTLLNGSIQYQALDSFSKMKITQTAPSKIATPEQLLEEIKQILG